MNSSLLCDRCGQPIPADAPEDLCPNCLLMSALPDGSVTESGGGRSPAAPDHPALAQTTPGIGSTPHSAQGSAPFAIPTPQSLGPLFPNLEIQSVLGQGGMGAVYQAKQTKLDRQVALKIIRPEAANDATFAERFNREAKTLGRLNHPNIVGVHDFGEVLCNGATLYYFVMEYVDGANLRHIMHSQGVAAEQAGLIVSQVCDALQYAHDEGVIHRDIKPENILLDRRGRVKIADFGLARLISSAPEDLALTGTHQVMGTPRYMAPEQMAGSRDVDHRADIYSLGVVYYEMLTGTLPLGSFDPPSAKSGSDPRLDQVVLRALASDPERRFQQVSELGRELLAVAPAVATSMSIHSGEFQVWPGPSTILENAVGGAWDRVRDGRFLQLIRHPQTPAVLAAILALVQILVSFDATATADAIRNSTGQKQATALTDAQFPILTAGVNAFVLLLVLFGFSSSQRFARWRPAVLLVGGAIATFCLMLAWDSIGSAQRYRSTAGLSSANFWFSTSLACTAGMLIAGTWDLRNWIQRSQPQGWPEAASSLRQPVHRSAAAQGHLAVSARPSQPSQSTAMAAPVAHQPHASPPVAEPGTAAAMVATVTDDEDLEDIAAQADIEAPSLSLILTGTFSFIAHGAGLVAADDAGRSEPGVLILSLWTSLAAAALMMVGGFHYRRRSSLAWARIGSIAGCLPVGPAILLTAIAGVYASRTLDKPSVRMAFFRETKRQRQRMQSEGYLSRKAIAGTIWAGLWVPALVMIAFVLVRQARSTGDSDATDWIPTTTLDVIPVLIVCTVPMVSSLLGAFSLAEIRRSGGRITGFGLAFFNVMFFPLILVDALIVGSLIGIARRVTEVSAPGPFYSATAAGFLLSALVDAVLLIWFWRILHPTRSSHGTADHNLGRPAARAVSHRSGVVGGPLSGTVRLAISDIEEGNLPSLCMACGQPATEAVHKTFQYQSNTAELMTAAGVMAGIIPGLLIAAGTQKTRKVCCPMCAEHRGHWSRLHWWAGTAWMIPLTTGTLGLVLAWLFYAPPDETRIPVRVFSAIGALLIGLAFYLVPLIKMASTRISCQHISGTHVELARVSPAFSRALHQAQSGEIEDEA